MLGKSQYKAFALNSSKAKEEPKKPLRTKNMNDILVLCGFLRLLGIPPRPYSEIQQEMSTFFVEEKTRDLNNKINFLKEEIEEIKSRHRDRMKRKGHQPDIDIVDHNSAQGNSTNTNSKVGQSTIDAGSVMKESSRKNTNELFELETQLPLTSSVTR